MTGKDLVFLLVIFSFGASLLCVSALSDTRENLLASVIEIERVAQEYIAAADVVSRGSLRDVRLDHVDEKEQHCNVLGTLLNVGDDVVADALQEDPGISSSDPQLLMLYAMSQVNYARAARQALAEDEFSWRYRWNLNCSGKWNSSAWFEVDDSNGYRVSLSSDGETLRVIGDIQPTLLDAIAKQLESSPSIRKLEVTSRGGSIGVAMKIGRLVRMKKLTTVLQSDCYSSCTLVFIAGTNRIVPAPYYSLGFHRITQNEIDVKDDDADYNAIKNYADDMIGAGDQFVNFWRSGSGEYFFRPDRTLFCTSKIATDVKGVCTVN